MTRQREELDDLIDRVATAMTFVPANPASARAIADRINARPQHSLAWSRLAAGVATILLVVAAFDMFRDGPAERIPTRVPTGEQADNVVERPPVAEPLVSPVVAAPARLGRRAAPAVPAAGAGGVPQIEALSSPALIEVAELPTGSLTIAPVDLAPLELADLAVPEIGLSPDAKE
jgi:hypothetical protein